MKTLREIYFPPLKKIAFWMLVFGAGILIYGLFGAETGKIKAHGVEADGINWTIITGLGIALFPAAWNYLRSRKK